MVIKLARLTISKFIKKSAIFLLVYTLKLFHASLSTKNIPLEKLEKLFQGFKVLNLVSRG
jgi:hypothetical protein